MMRMAGRLLLLAFALLAAAGLLRLRFDANVLDLLPPDLAEVQGLKIFLTHFGLPSELIITVEGPDAETAGGFAESLAAALRENTPSLVRAAPPWMERPESLVPLAAHALINQSPEQFRLTLDKLTPDKASQRASEAIENLATTLAPEEIALQGYDPLGLLEGLSATTDPERANREFSSADGSFRILYATPKDSAKNSHPPRDWIEGVIRQIDSWRRADPERQAAQTGWTGEPAFVHEISSAMSSDMRLSSFMSLGFAAALFYFVYRRVRPLARMMAYVVASFLGALGLAAWVFPDLSIISVGFAAILAGITVDYGFLLYQCRLRTGGDLARLRSTTTPGILAAAATTAAAFSSLNFSGLPGIAQLGTTVAIGVLLGAFLMIRFFSSDLARMVLPEKSRSGREIPRGVFQFGGAVALLLFVVSAIGLVWRGLPAWAVDTQSMRPRESIAYPSLDRMSLALGDDKPTVQVLATGSSFEEVSEKLTAARAILRNAQAGGVVEGFELPDALWPNPEWRAENLTATSNAVSRKDSLRALLEETGFSETGTALTSGVLDSWTGWVESGSTEFPDGEAFDWIARRTMSRDGGEFAACGFFTPTPDGDNRTSAELARSGLFPTSWSQLGQALAAHALTRGILTLAGFFAAMAVVLSIAFRNATDVLLALGVNLLGLAMLNGLMSLLGMEWNFMNLCALTLTIGLGVDYSIHVIFALRSTDENREAAFADVGKALGLCALTTIAGFASLAAAQTEGLAALGRTCALGVGVNALVALFLLPSVHAWFQKKQAAAVRFD